MFSLFISYLNTPIQVINFNADKDSGFISTVFLLSSIMLDVYLFEVNISPLAGNCLRRCELSDPQSNYSPLIFTKPYNPLINRCNWFLMPLFCEPLSETVYYIFSFQNNSCLHIVIGIWWWPVIHPLYTHLLTFVYLCVLVSVLCNVPYYEAVRVIQPVLQPQVEATPVLELGWPHALFNPKNEVCIPTTRDDIIHIVLYNRY